MSFLKAFITKIRERREWREVEAKIRAERESVHRRRYGPGAFDRADRDEREARELEALLHIFYYLPRGLFYMEPDYLRGVVASDFNVLAPAAERLPLDVSDEKLRTIIVGKAKRYYAARSGLLEMLGDAFVNGLKIRHLEYPHETPPGPEPLKEFCKSTQGFAQTLEAQREAFGVKRPSWEDIHASIKQYLGVLLPDEIYMGVQSFNRLYRFKPSAHIPMPRDLGDNDIVAAVQERVHRWRDEKNGKLNALENCLREICLAHPWHSRLPNTSRTNHHIM